VYGSGFHPTTHPAGQPRVLHIARSVTQQVQPVAQALGTRGPHEGIVADLEHDRAQDPRQDGALPQGQRQRGQLPGLQGFGGSAAFLLGPAQEVAGAHPLQRHVKAHDQQARLTSQHKGQHRPGSCLGPAPRQRADTGASLSKIQRLLGIFMPVCGGQQICREARIVTGIALRVFTHGSGLQEALGARLADGLFGVVPAEPAQDAGEG
jgi:hypothetical protein